MGERKHSTFEFGKVCRLEFGRIAILQDTGNHQPVIGIESNQVSIKCLVMKSIQAKTIGWVGTTVFVFAPWNDMAGNKVVEERLSLSRHSDFHSSLKLYCGRISGDAGP